MKANQAKFPVSWYGSSVTLVNSPLSYQLAGIVDFGIFQSIDNQHQIVHEFVMSWHTSQAVFRLTYQDQENTLDANGHVVDPWCLQCLSYANPHGIGITLQMVKQYGQNPALAVYVRFDGVQAGPDTNDNVLVTHYIRSLQNLHSTMPTNTGLIGNLYWTIPANADNTSLNNYSITASDDMRFVKGQSGYTNSGPLDPTPIGHSKLVPIAIPSGADLNNYSFPGYYANYSSSGITNLPSGVVYAFNLEVSPYSAIGVPGTSRMVLQRLETLTATGTGPFVNHSIVWERVSNQATGALSWSPWEAVGKAVHTHPATDIVTDSTHLFVTQAEIDAWNALSAGSSYWNTPVATVGALSGPIGSTRFVTGTGYFYTNVGGVWVPTSANSIPNADATHDGILTAADWTRFGQSYFGRLANNNAWVMTPNPNTVYGASFANLPNDVLDMVTRATPLSSILGQKSIAFGFEDSRAGGAYGIVLGSSVTANGANATAIGYNFSSNFANIVAIGAGMLADAAGAVVLGRWNTSPASGGYGFMIGNGGGSGSRANLFGVTTGGVAVLAGGYSVTGKTSDDVLTGDGGSFSKSAFEAAILAVTNSGSKTEIYLKPGFSQFVLDWSLFSAQYGSFGNIAAYSLIDKNKYSSETLPTIMKTGWVNSSALDPTLTQLDLNVLSLSVSGGNWVLSGDLVPALGETSGYTLQWANDAGGATWANLSTTSTGGVIGAQSIPVSSLPNGLKLRVLATSLSTTGPVYHIGLDYESDLAVLDIDWPSGENGSGQYVNVAKQALSYTIDLSNLEALLIIS
jgi:hypothetical protein